MAHRTRLQPPERERQRVRDLARDLQVPSAEIMERLECLGEYVKSELSFIEAPTIKKIRADYGSVVQPRQHSLKPWGPEVPRPGEGLEQPRHLPRRENNPYLGEVTICLPAQPQEGDALDTSRTRPRADGGRGHTFEAPPPADYTPAMAFEASETMKDWEWKVRGFTEIERDVWLDAGLSPRQAKFAAECRESGLYPTDLARDVAGSTILYRITHGESAWHVARLARRQADAG